MTMRTMSLHDVIISVIMSAQYCSQTGSVSVTKRECWRQRNTWLFLFNKLIKPKFGFSNSTAFAVVIRQRLEWQVSSACK